MLLNGQAKDSFFFIAVLFREVSNLKWPTNFLIRSIHKIHRKHQSPFLRGVRLLALVFKKLGFDILSLQFLAQLTLAQIALRLVLQYHNIVITDSEMGSWNQWNNNGSQNGHWNGPKQFDSWTSWYTNGAGKGKSKGKGKGMSSFKGNGYHGYDGHNGNGNGGGKGAAVLTPETVETLEYLTAERKEKQAKEQKQEAKKDMIETMCEAFGIDKPNITGNPIFADQASSQEVHKAPFLANTRQFFRRLTRKNTEEDDPQEGGASLKRSRHDDQDHQQTPTRNKTPTESAADIANAVTTALTNVLPGLLQKQGQIEASPAGSTTASSPGSSKPHTETSPGTDTESERVKSPIRLFKKTTLPIKSPKDLISDEEFAFRKAVYDFVAPILSKEPKDLKQADWEDQLCKGLTQPKLKTHLEAHSIKSGGNTKAKLFNALIRAARVDFKRRL